MTAPLTPHDCDLRNFEFMPLDVQRLRDSDLAALESPEACWAAVLLWCAAWHQVPAASLPDDDRVLASLAGYGRVVKEWLKVKEGALRGFIACDDGRLYHPAVAEKANEAWRGKLEQRWRTECARIKKFNQRHHTSHVFPDMEQWIAGGCICVAPEEAKRLVYSTKAYFQEGFQRRILDLIEPAGRGRRKFWFLYQGQKAPHSPCLVETSEAGRTIADDQVSAAINLWKPALVTGEFPGYEIGPHVASPPDWMMKRWIEREENDPNINTQFEMELS